MGSAVASFLRGAPPTEPWGPPAPRDPAVALRDGLARLVAGGEPPDGVRETITVSWQRSVASGLRPDRLEVPYEPHVGDGGSLARAARAVTDPLAVEVTGARAGVVLADARGRIVDRRVSEAALTAHLDHVRLAPGRVYAESAVGTNVIGTALAQRAPVTVEGDQHFAAALTMFGGAAAPIADPGTGHLLGAIGLVAMATDAHPLMLPLAVRAARDIEHRLLDDTDLPAQLLLHRFLRTRRGAKGPVVLLTDATMIANAAADRLVDLADEPALRRAARRLQSGDGDGGVTTALARGATVRVEVVPSREARPPAGVILRLTASASSGGRGRQDGPVMGWDSLTDTERSVADLVAQGLTNREAAERLFLSRHTVGFHLRSIFRKLGTSTRVELARLAVEARPTTGRPTGDTRGAA